MKLKVTGTEDRKAETVSSHEHVCSAVTEELCSGEQNYSCLLDSLTEDFYRTRYNIDKFSKYCCLLTCMMLTIILLSY